MSSPDNQGDFSVFSGKPTVRVVRLKPNQQPPSVAVASDQTSEAAIPSPITSLNAQEVPESQPNRTTIQSVATSIIERDVTNFHYKPVEKCNVSSGFPQPKSRSQSKFLGKARNKSANDPINPVKDNSNSCLDVSNSLDIPKMTQIELEEAQNEIRELLSADSINYLKSHSKFSQLDSTISIVDPNTNTLTSLASSSSVDYSKVLSFEDLDKLVDQCLPVREKLKLSWTQPTSQDTSVSCNNLDGDDEVLDSFLSSVGKARVDLNGQVISDTSANFIPELHHHEGKSEEAGYTTSDLLTLCQSSNISQRRIGLDVLRKMLELRYKKVVEAMATGQQLILEEIPSVASMLPIVLLDAMSDPRIDISTRACLAMEEYLIPFQVWRDMEVCYSRYQCDALLPVLLNPHALSRKKFKSFGKEKYTLVVKGSGDDFIWRSSDVSYSEIIQQENAALEQLNNASDEGSSPSMVNLLAIKFRLHPPKAFVDGDGIKCLAKLLEIHAMNVNTHDNRVSPINDRALASIWRILRHVCSSCTELADTVFDQLIPKLESCCGRNYFDLIFPKDDDVAESFEWRCDCLSFLTCAIKSSRSVCHKLISSLASDSGCLGSVLACANSLLLRNCESHGSIRLLSEALNFLRSLSSYGISSCEYNMFLVAFSCNSDITIIFPALKSALLKMNDKEDAQLINSISLVSSYCLWVDEMMRTATGSFSVVVVQAILDQTLLVLNSIKSCDVKQTLAASSAIHLVATILLEFGQQAINVIAVEAFALDLLEVDQALTKCINNPNEISLNEADYLFSLVRLLISLSARHNGVSMNSVSLITGNLCLDSPKYAPILQRFARGLLSVGFSLVTVSDGPTRVCIQRLLFYSKLMTMPYLQPDDTAQMLTFYVNLLNVHPKNEFGMLYVLLWKIIALLSTSANVQLDLSKFSIMVQKYLGSEATVLSCHCRFFRLKDDTGFKSFEDMHRLNHNLRFLWNNRLKDYCFSCIIQSGDTFSIVDDKYSGGLFHSDWLVGLISVSCFRDEYAPIGQQLCIILKCWIQLSQENVACGVFSLGRICFSISKLIIRSCNSESLPRLIVSREFSELLNYISAVRYSQGTAYSRDYFNSLLSLDDQLEEESGAVNVDKWIKRQHELRRTQSLNDFVDENVELAQNVVGNVLKSGGEFSSALLLLALVNLLNSDLYGRKTLCVQNNEVKVVSSVVLKVEEYVDLHKRIWASLRQMRLFDVLCVNLCVCSDGGSSNIPLSCFLFPISIDMNDELITASIRIISEGDGTIQSRCSECSHMSLCFLVMLHRICWWAFVDNILPNTALTLNSCASCERPTTGVLCDVCKTHRLRLLQSLCGSALLLALDSLCQKISSHVGKNGLNAYLGSGIREILDFC